MSDVLESVMDIDTHILLDMRGLVLRSLHGGGVDPEATKDPENGRPLNTPGHCLEGFIKDILLPTLQEFRLKRVIAVWDGGNDYRLKLSGGNYKNKDKEKKSSPELDQCRADAIKAVKGVLTYLGVMQVVVDTVEADDVIAHLVERLPTNKIIHTVDRDLLRLAAPRADGTEVAVCCGREWATEFKDSEVEVPFRWVTLYKSMVGDSSDNIKGVPGIGPKTWVKLVDYYGYDNLQELEDAVETCGFATLHKVVDAEPGQHPLLKKLLDHKADWRLSYQLAKLHPELVGARQQRRFLRENVAVRLPNAAKLSALLTHHGCQHLLEQFTPYLPRQVLITAANATEQEILEDAAILFAESPFIALDWETSAPDNPNFLKAANGRDVVDMLSSTVTGFGITCGRDLQHTFYFSINHADTQNLSAWLIPKMMELMGDKPKVIHNVYFEATVYKTQFGLDLTHCHDTKVMANHWDETTSSSLKDLSRQLFHYDQTKYRDIIEVGKTMEDYSAEYVFQYGADDPLVTAHLYEFLKFRLQVEGTWEFVKKYEFTAILPLVDAYLNGVEMDWALMEKLAAEDQAGYDEAMARLRELLKKVQTEATFTSGVARLVEYEREVVEAVTEKEKVPEVMASIRTGLMGKVEYQDLTLEPVVTVIPVTLNKLNTACEYLGLPAMLSVKKPDVANWLEEARDSLDGSEPAPTARFVELVGECSGRLHEPASKNQTPERKQLSKLLTELTWEKLPEDKKYLKKGTELNLNSNKQMQHLLYGMLDLPMRLRAFEATGVRKEHNLPAPVQANEDAIRAAIAEDAPEGSWKREALACLLKAKKADTRIKMFYNAYPLWRHPLTGKVHAQLNSCDTGSRRMAGNSPNLMQLPKRNEGVKFRYCFLPSKARGHDVIISIDFSGEELRVGAGLSLDEKMLGCFIDADTLKTLPGWMIKQLGEDLCELFSKSELMDIHSQTGAKILGIPYAMFEEIRHNKQDPEYGRISAARGRGKTVNFGAQYGIGAPKLSRQLLCPPEEAQTYIDAKKAVFAGYEKWRERVIQGLHKDGFVKTLYGSVKHVYDKLFDSDAGMVGYLERSSVNYKIQGLCADYLKVVLTDIWEREVLQRHDVHLIAPIHDELVFSANSKRAPAFICEVHEVMVQGIPGLPCPIWAEPSLGPNFGSQTEIGPWPTLELVEEALDTALNRTNQ